MREGRLTDSAPETPQPKTTKDLSQEFIASTAPFRTFDYEDVSPTLRKASYDERYATIKTIGQDPVRQKQLWDGYNHSIELGLIHHLAAQTDLKFLANKASNPRTLLFHYYKTAAALMADIRTYCKEL